MRILLTGGGTGGHVAPLIAVARELKKIARERQISNLEIFYVGPNGFSQELLQNENIFIKIISAGKIRRYFSFANILDFFKLPLGLLQALWQLFFIMPDSALGKGGYGSFPTIIACWTYRIPIILHESDAIPGLANHFLSRFAKRIAISFSSTQNLFSAEKTAFVGNPIRTEITQGSKQEAEKIFNLKGQKPILFIFGGSQGAQAINALILGDLPQMIEKYELIWQTGKSNFEAVTNEIKEIFGDIPANCHILPFLDEQQVANAYAAAELVISRAGASNIFEIAACGKPSITIPLPTSASDHQKENAFEYARSGATVVLEQANLTPHLLISEITRILSNPELKNKMSEHAKSFAKPDAARIIAEELINLANN